MQKLFDCFWYGQRFSVTFIISAAKHGIFKQVFAIKKDLDTWIERKSITGIIYFTVVVVCRLNQSSWQNIR